MLERLLITRSGDKYIHVYRAAQTHLHVSIVNLVAITSHSGLGLPRLQERVSHEKTFLLFILASMTEPPEAALQENKIVADPTYRLLQMCHVLHEQWMHRHIHITMCNLVTI